MLWLAWEMDFPIFYLWLVLILREIWTAVWKYCKKSTSNKKLTDYNTCTRHFLGPALRKLWKKTPARAAHIYIPHIWKYPPPGSLITLSRIILYLLLMSFRLLYMILNLLLKDMIIFIILLLLFFFFNFPRSSLITLLNIYNHIWQTNIFPAAWREAIVIPIPKPNKDKTNPLNYRPIAPTSCICKVMERMINNRLTWFLVK